jgi:hypothetical protein
MMKRIFSLIIVLIIILLGLTVTTNATLIDRGGGMIYDTDLNITWLQDASYAETSGYNPYGHMDWGLAVQWADNLVYQGYDDWRLPDAHNQDGSGPSVGFISTSELGHLYYTELRNPIDGPLTNTGPFINLLSRTYWEGNLDIDPLYAWYFGFNFGYQMVGYRPSTSFYVWAVRDGDVAPVPEPSTMLLFGPGLVGLVGLRKKFKK